ncbi:hypothetical protein PG996_002850 [Apiospora saccharicola]|uniref:DUF924-domain-containing protein n=1 Tax=Apiospora saccharicola TaxID=335842 RepID=A0ABR1WKM1_9PEZI
MSAVNVDPNVQRVLNFWFDRNPIEWIIAPAGLDDQLKSNFGDLVHKARNRELDSWTTASPESSVALVALLDQFSRNLFRGTPEAFAGDDQAWEVAVRALSQDFDKRVPVVQASTFCMTLLNRESLISVIAARCLWDSLKARCETQQEHEWVDMGIAGTKRHLAQLERFGRYPTRNKMLGRESTEAEEEFLKEHKPSLK